MRCRPLFLYPLSLLTAFAASSPKGTPLRYAGNFTSTAKSRPLGEGGKAAGFDGRGIPPRGCFRRKPARQFAAYRCDPSREKAILENPQIFQNCEKNNSSSEYAQSASGGHSQSSSCKKRLPHKICAAAFQLILPVQPWTLPHRLRSCRSGSVPRHGRSRRRGVAGRDHAPWRESPVGWAGG